MENDVKVLKLITGDVIMARVEQKDTILILDSPMILLGHPNQRTGQLGISLSPWFMAGKNKKITISIDHVIAQDDPNDAPEKNYLSTRK